MSSGLSPSFSYVQREKSPYSHTSFLGEPKRVLIETSKSLDSSLRVLVLGLVLPFSQRLTAFACCDYIISAQQLKNKQLAVAKR